MENTSYYLESEGLIFLTEEDARKYYFEGELYRFGLNHIDLSEFLSGQGYTYEDIFFLDGVEKEGIVSDYHEALFSLGFVKISPSVIYLTDVNGCKLLLAPFPPPPLDVYTSKLRY